MAAFQQDKTHRAPPPYPQVHVKQHGISITIFYSFYILCSNRFLLFVVQIEESSAESTENFVFFSIFSGSCLLMHEKIEI